MQASEVCSEGLCRKRPLAEGQCGCLQGSASAVWWDGAYLHPKQLSGEEVSAQLIDQLRNYDPSDELSCDAPDALQASAILLPAVRRSALAC